jgi:hypothetical protein
MITRIMMGTSASQIVLAFEYGEWQPMSFSLFPEYGRFVLFGNGEVRLLDSAGFSKSLEADARRRRVLGWPEQMSRPLGNVSFAKPTPSSLPADCTAAPALTEG